MTKNEKRNECSLKIYKIKIYKLKNKLEKICYEKRKQMSLFFRVNNSFLADGKNRLGLGKRRTVVNLAHP